MSFLKRPGSARLVVFPRVCERRAERDRRGGRSDAEHASLIANELGAGISKMELKLEKTAVPVEMIVIDHMGFQGQQEGPVRRPPESLHTATNASVRF